MPCSPPFFLLRLTNFHQLRSGLGSSAPHRPAPYRSAIVRCNAALVCFAALPCCVLCGSLYMPVTFIRSIIPRTCTINKFVPVHTTLLDHNAPPAKVSPVIYSSAVQRGIVRCRVLPFCHSRSGIYQYYFFICNYYYYCCILLIAKHRCTTQLTKLSFNHAIGRTHS